jgi:outer membrane protein
MKHFKTLLFAGLLFIGATNFTNAQSKVAHINTQELVAAMPEMLSAKAELEKLQKSYETEIQTLATELKKKMELYQSEVETKTDEENEKRAIEVQQMQQSIREYQGQAQQDLQKKEYDLVKPLTDKAIAAIKKVSTAQGFDYVLDSTNGGGVLVANGKDLMADVKKELGF